MRWMLVVALALAGCRGDKHDPPPEPDVLGPKTPMTPAPPGPRPAPPKPTAPAGDPPDCAALRDGVDVAALCGTAVPVELDSGPGARCELLPATNAPRGYLLRIEVTRAQTPRLPDRYPAAGWREVRGKTSAARLGVYPWLIDVKTRGPEAPLCTADEIAALAARVGQLIPSDPEAVARPPTPQCDSILTVAQINKVCGAAIEKLAVDMKEDGGERFCSRGGGGFGFEVGVGLRTAGAVFGPVRGDYALALRATARSGCDRAELERLLEQALPRAKKALRAARK